jgi:TetR/AcrR family transcriptional regulator, lmrAB and yxaGH operons repressor
VSKQIYLPTLLQLFRQFGYEGVTLSKIAQATGLGKASLYHHFPGGKAEMAAAALMEVDSWLETSILPILLGKGPHLPIDKFTAMCSEVNQFFNEGKNSCLWAVLVMERSSDDLFHTQIRGAFLRWIDAISIVLIAAGLDESLANQRGEDAIVAIQGALILCHGLRDFGAFDRVLKQLPPKLCEGIVKG